MAPVMDVLELSVGGASGSLPGTGWPPMPPHDTDWILPFGAVLVAFFFVACIMVSIILRCGRCKERQLGMSMFEHKCLMASFTTVFLLVLSLGSLYYFYCYRGGCFGGAVAGPAAGIAGRKAKMMSK